MSETSELTGPLIKMLNQTGGLAMRMPVGKLKKGPYWIQLHEEGTADILFFPRNKIFGQRCAQPVWIETKDPENGDRNTSKKRKEAQADFKAKVEALGHRYIRATTIDEGMEALK